MSKPIASLSLDLDNQWSYMKNHGVDGWENHPSYLEIIVPHILSLLEELKLKITFFIVGQDAVYEHNKPFIRMLAESGHNIANHSFKHETFLHLYSKEELIEEINQSHEIITSVSGKEPKGFRGPGFSWNETLLEILADKGYTFDASTFPTSIGPLARMYYFRTANLTMEERKERKELFGKFSDAFRLLRPYFWNLKNDRQLLEMPVTTMPLFRTPMHMTYLMYLSSISKNLMLLYLTCAVYLCKLTRTRPSFLLHPLDLIGGDKVKGLDTFPGMNISSEEKEIIFKKVMSVLQKHFTLVTMEEHASTVLNNAKLKYITP
ncbi:polysaccharide deacetylase family protein [uncultured Eudoraea sp.]|uniref:polysaccharide deacetylase family protein n=1 Tax=uncultured Eudoraea sp. TaxID=1035614 RepID=UPI002604BC84|nr:polysaccharide deacetylase family protein [uncultured Eudoraea sp.]